MDGDYTTDRSIAERRAEKRGFTLRVSRGDFLVFVEKNLDYPIHAARATTGREIITACGRRIRTAQRFDNDTPISCLQCLRMRRAARDEN